jgi:hypothetical protein
VEQVEGDDACGFGDGEGFAQLFQAAGVVGDGAFLVAAEAREGAQGGVVFGDHGDEGVGGLDGAGGDLVVFFQE